MNRERPNIVFILTDDQGPWAAGCYGNRELRTSNIDRIAATGMRFDSFFCASPVCSPSRASFLTGLMPEQRRRIRELRGLLESWFAEQATAQHDGRNLPVAGGGQLRPVGGTWEDGSPAFVAH